MGWPEVTIGNCRLILGDCREVVPTLGAIDAVVTDPPYGVNHDKKAAVRRYKITCTMTHDSFPPDVRWLSDIPSIIWGGNNFCDQLPRSTGWLVWYKYHPPLSQHSQAELAWTNVVRTIRFYQEAYSGFMRPVDGWFHPPQKPPGLMRWCLQFMKDHYTVLDPFMGSGTTGIACAQLGRPFTGSEIESRFFDIACRRIEEAYAQSDMFMPMSLPPQQLSLGVV